ncbi:Extracellular protease precursor [Alloactinosynnema sp. L-07]|uniref:S8 family peptidase n=1 Tax=Alloactinosynnema sp. L-07 TaxID=1653480 RepID=UPI00065EF082|nr:S8 family peptidase [Alloactinosynnema sp. L-07]CRK60372.1 Extracellular protease precursor [Alloactinosynnema sp. L-07]
MKKRYISAFATLGMAVAGLTIPSLVGTAQAGQEEAAAAGYDQFIVSYSDTSAASRSLAGVTRVRDLGTGDVVVRANRGLNRSGAAKLMNDLRKQAGVVSVEPDLIMTAQTNDSRYAEQWDLFEATAGMNAPAAWTTADGAGVTVAVIDTGIVGHSDLNTNVLPGYDFISDATSARDGNGRDANPNDEGDWYAAGECGQANPSNSSWHGSHVAGTIAAVSDNTNGIAGIAAKAKIVPVRVLGKCGGRTSDIADAITWASGGKVSRIPNNPNPAKVINMSLGGASSCSSVYQRAIDNAVKRGTTVVVAAGNSNMDVANFTPANCNNVVSVAASDREGNRAFYSNFGPKIDVTAPGGEVRNETDPPGTRTKPQDGILSTINAGTTVQTVEDYKTFMGTSMAAPHVAGLAALMLGEKSMTPAQVEAALKANTRPLAGTCSGGCGTGLIDAGATIANI